MVKPQLTLLRWRPCAARGATCCVSGDRRSVTWRRQSLVLAGLLALWLAVPAAAQVGPPAADGGYRRLAPGVVTEINPKLEEEETFSGPREIVELVGIQPTLEWNPHFAPQSKTLMAMAKQTIFRRQIWALEFGFKPLRMISVDLPGRDGSVASRQVWYLVYYVKNNGRQLNPAPQKDAQGNEIFTTERVDHTVRFFPSFIIQCHDVGQAYLDQVLPLAVERIRMREDPRHALYNSVSISDISIPVSTASEDHSVWGVATWVGVDPRSDFFSLYVQGLTNAYRWQDPENAFQPGDPPGTGRRLSFKTLQLNFWRPGDAINPEEREFRFGVPNKAQLPPSKTEDEVLRIYGLQERVDYQWVYR